MSELRHIINKTELLSLIKEDHKVDISSTTSIDDLVSILEDIDDFEGFKWCPLTPIKEQMEAYIQKHIRKMRTQLPGCNGKCTTFGCPEGVVLNCSIKLDPLLNSGDNKNGK